MTKKLILCDCSGTQSLDKEAIEAATGLRASRVHSALCTDELDRAAAAIETGDALICCGQEARIFRELADEMDHPEPGFVDLRDRAGWSDDSALKLPKMAALVAEATLQAAPEKSVDVISEGLCLIIGTADVALSAADKLADMLSVTVLLTDASEPPSDRRFDAIRGRVARATGALGQFVLTLDALQQVVPGGRGALGWTKPRDGGQTGCDIILDLTGGIPLFPAPEKREGYLRADPRSLPAVADAILGASQMVGTFEKPLYVALAPHLCAHSRAGQVGCSNCLDICPTSAIAPAGEHVEIDPMVCAGCGECAAVCPSGAITYDAPPPDLTFRRIETLASAYRKAGGTAPRLLVHDAGFGAEMIRLIARHGPGLPADMIPLDVTALAGFGHAEILAALASGFADVTLMLSPTTERDALDREVPLARAIAGEDAVLVHALTDPDELGHALFNSTARTKPCAKSVLPMGSRRQVTRLAAKALHPETDILPLPENAPYGAVLVDTEACTLCLSCISLCPSGALNDNPDKPELKFQEDACLQCGICATICPEDAIGYVPRLNLTDTALTQVTLNEEEPFACVECGTLFGSRSTIERIMGKLAGNHPMFATSDQARMIQMCDDCRVNAQYHIENNPLGGRERPRPRTTDDYLSKRRDH